MLRIEEPAPNDDDEQDDAPHPMEGNLWMIQCKREKELGPKRVEAIIKGSVMPNTSSYGFILAAPANFSKAAHDRFRDELIKRSVMEFYLWGAGELEDMLYQPKNDHILFAFFGISLTSRRRMRSSEIRATVSAKNKLLRVLGDYPRHQPVLLRDINDTNYPYADHYKDFAKRPRWKQFSALEFHPLGLIVSVGRYYAYYDKSKREWDFTRTVNKANYALGSQQQLDDESVELGNAVCAYWEQLLHAQKVIFVEDRLIKFDSIVLIDEKGDSEHQCPHLYVDFRPESGPFSVGYEYLEINEQAGVSLDGLTRVKIFPETFQKPRFGTVYKDKLIVLDDRTRATLKRYAGRVTLYALDDEYAYLRLNDVIGVEKTEDTEGKKTLLKITNVRAVTGNELLDLSKENPSLRREIEDQLTRELKQDDPIHVIEALAIYDWQLQQNRPVV